MMRHGVAVERRPTVGMTLRSGVFGQGKRMTVGSRNAAC